jgi:hypothetical protein
MGFLHDDLAEQRPAQPTIAGNLDEKASLAFDPP